MIENMNQAKPKIGNSTKDKPMHYSVGALIRKGDKYLLIDRVKPPYGYAGLAGHVDEGEEPESALSREVKEESGLKVISYKIIQEEELDWNKCSKGTETHYWYLYECEVEGNIKRNFSETKDIGWFTKEEISKLNLEPVWKYWFEKEGILK